MGKQPNILFLMTDQMQGRVLDPHHPCSTPNFDRLAQRGVRCRQAYTPNAICSPARASLMTGLLPHNHGVLSVIHTADSDQYCLRTSLPHWGQILEQRGYYNGYFGKWHIERSNRLEDFGWHVNGNNQGRLWNDKRESILGDNPQSPRLSLRCNNNQPKGYRPSIFYGVIDTPPEQRPVGITTALAHDFLDQALGAPSPWCCFVSVTEPHDPFVAGERAFARYDVESIDLPPNVDDDLVERPNIYQKAARVWSHINDQQRREAMACYWAMISEIDTQYGSLVDRINEAGQLDRTLIVLTSDHGELLGAHGLYCKNFTASEEVYNIPMVIAGPGCAENITTDGRVGLHDLCPTLLDLVGCEPIGAPDSRSFADLLADPRKNKATFTSGYAEYFGGRMILTQRIVWEGPWKFVFNGFDFDELYNLETDPWELRNRANNPTCKQRLEDMTRRMWERVRNTGDRSLLESHYPILRVASVGPEDPAGP